MLYDINIIQIMPCHLFGVKSSTEPIMNHYQLDPWEHSNIICFKMHQFTYIWTYPLQNVVSHFPQSSMCWEKLSPFQSQSRPVLPPSCCQQQPCLHLWNWVTYDPSRGSQIISDTWPSVPRRTLSQEIGFFLYSVHELVPSPAEEKEGWMV